MLGDGAVFISVVANHAVVDDTSFWHFYNTWAALCRGASPKLPDFRRNFFGESTAVLRFAGGVGPAVTSMRRPFERIFHFRGRNRGEISSLRSIVRRRYGSRRQKRARRRRDDDASPGGELPSQAAPGGLPCLLRQRHPERAHDGDGGGAGIQRPAVGGVQAEREPGGVAQQRPRRWFGECFFI
ncbi:hypothetical protein ZWY2020_027913 [Hordeum vulgare]|nr:hypothetical protein ZWY2020_027913 [Hordeum vulgare]